MKTTILSIWIALLTFLTLGLGYPLAMTGLAQILFPVQANGSLIRNGAGSTVGSALIGQDWSVSAIWFRGRPSATGGSPYNPQASGGSNLSPHGKAYSDRISADRLAWEALAQKAGQKTPVPSVLLTTSGSGLDPHLNLEAALWQVPLVAHARNIDRVLVEKIVTSHTVAASMPWDPAPYVNLLEVNLALDQAFPTH